MKLKKPFFKTVVGRILLTVAGMIIKNQKGIKGTPNAEKVDRVLDEIK